MNTTLTSYTSCCGVKKEVVSLVLVTQWTSQSFFYAIKRLKVHTKNLNAKSIINIKEANCFDCILAMNENRTKVTAVLIVVTLLLYSDLRGKVHHSGWCAYVLSWAW